MSDSEGLFARRHLEKYGWKKGKGLGRSESGITDAIKPKLKFDTAGIGHDAGEQFSFHWWDHVFNKAAKNIQIENDEDGVKVRQKEDKTNLITNKRTTHDKKNKSLLYGSFVKHGTLNSDGVISQDKELSSSSDDSDDDKPPDTYEGNDEMLFKACGGRTAHKGARHGLHLSGKLQRIEEQDNHHSNMMKTQIVTNGVLSDDEVERKENNQTVKNRMKNKEKKHRSKERRKGEEEIDIVENAQDANGIHVQEEEITSGENIDLEQKPSKRKKKRKHLDNYGNLETISDIDGIGEEAVNENLILPEIQLKEDDESIDVEMYKKKKSKKEKKKKRTIKEINSKEFGMSDSQEDSLSADEPARKNKSKKKKKRIELDDKIIHLGEEFIECREQKDSKRKRKKERIASNECVDNDTRNEVRIVDVEELKPKKKKKKMKD